MKWRIATYCTEEGQSEHQEGQARCSTLRTENEGQLMFNADRSREEFRVCTSVDEVF